MLLSFRLRPHLKRKATGPLFLAFPLMSYTVSHSFSTLHNLSTHPGCRLSIVNCTTYNNFLVSQVTGLLVLLRTSFFSLLLIFSLSYLSYFYIFVTTLSQSHSTFHIKHATRFKTSPLNCHNDIQLQSTRRLCRCSMTCGKEITAVQ